MKKYLFIGLLQAVAFVLLSGCAVHVDSTAIELNGGKSEIYIAREIPKRIPDKLSRIPDTQYLLVQTDTLGGTALGMLVPVPFIDDAVSSSFNGLITNKTSTLYKQIDPYEIVIDDVKQHPLFSRNNAYTVMYPYVVVQESKDDVFRLSLVYQIEKGEWVGRYLYHLPTTYPTATFGNMSGNNIAAMRKDLDAGAKLLVSLVERDVRGELTGNGEKLELGSYYILGSYIGGYLSPDLMHVRDVEMVEEGDDYIIVRSGGEPTASVSSLGMAFGVHYFKKDQLYFFKKSDKQ